MDYQDLVLELKISDNISLKELKDIYTMIKYIPWNEKEIFEIKRVHTIITSKNKGHYDPKSFNKDVKVNTPHPRSIPIPKIMKKPKKNKI